ncbi:hypothetical protein FV222_00200 [Methylobacterium sp. WL103]|uniref:hypothetical protein n=1 Tax=Methylobacterium sp. WL103 TaxID=2603891 RepID=UPI0011C8EEB1|nr:hypothetical protein [Methylobacterium sp. WL103]TXN08927.1 hypothetical protein FV222_00200 [Methylobacterium sp. WL103]
MPLPVLAVMIGSHIVIPALYGLYTRLRNPPPEAGGPPRVIFRGGALPHLLGTATPADFDAYYKRQRAERADRAKGAGEKEWLANGVPKTFVKKGARQAEPLRQEPEPMAGEVDVLDRPAALPVPVPPVHAEEVVVDAEPGLARYISDHPGIIDVWHLTRIRKSPKLHPDRLPECILYAMNEEQAHRELLILAGLDDETVEIIRDETGVDLSYDHFPDMDTFVQVLSEHADGDTFTWCQYEVQTPIRPEVADLLAGKRRPQ